MHILLVEADRDQVKKFIDTFRQSHPDIRISVAPEGEQDLKEYGGQQASVQKLTEQLYQSEKMAAIGQLVSGVTHELNNPLTGILGYSELLMMGSLEPKTLDFVKKIYDSALRCRKIVNNLLSFSRRHSLDAGPADMNEVLRNTLALRGYEMKVNNIEVVEDYARDLPPVRIDVHQMQQVFLNLMINAEHALQGRPGARMTLSTALAVRDGEEFIRVSVSDNGPGIRKDQLGLIFEPFYTTKEPGKGTGLGLPICKSIISEHRGSLRAESEEGKGAVFIVEVPMAGEKIRKECSGRRKVLLVDDERAILEVMSEVLHERGFEVETAAGGEEALDKIKSFDYDLVVSDIKMQGGDGGRLYRQVRMAKPDMAARILFITGDITAPEAMDLAEDKNSNYLLKPFTVDDFTKACNTCLEKSGLSALA